jgi:hypothetical protein
VFKKIKNYLGDFVDDVKAARRGDKRVAPRGQGLRGRVYERPGEDGPFNVVRLKSSPTATLTMTITRADGSVETIKVPASAVAVSE